MSDTGAPPRVWLATIHHKHGVNGYAAVTEQQLRHDLAEYARDWWADAVARDPELAAEPPLDDRGAIARYFEAVEDEQLGVADEVLSGAAIVVAAAPTSSARSAGQRRLMVVEFLSGLGGKTEEQEDDLAVLVHDATNGDLSMAVVADVTEEVDGPTLAQLATAQGTDPSFFGIDADGHLLEDE